MYYNYTDLAFPGHTYEDKVRELAASYHPGKTVARETPVHRNYRDLMVAFLSLLAH